MAKKSTTKTTGKTTTKSTRKAGGKTPARKTAGKSARTTSVGKKRATTLFEASCGIASDDAVRQSASKKSKSTQTVSAQPDDPAYRVYKWDAALRNGLKEKRESQDMTQREFIRVAVRSSCRSWLRVWLRWG